MWKRNKHPVSSSSVGRDTLLHEENGQTDSSWQEGYDNLNTIVVTERAFHNA